MVGLSKSVVQLVRLINSLKTFIQDKMSFKKIRELFNISNDLLEQKKNINIIIIDTFVN